MIHTWSVCTDASGRALVLGEAARERLPELPLRGETTSLDAAKRDAARINARHRSDFHAPPVVILN